MRQLQTRIVAFCLGLFYVLAVSVASAQPAPPKLLRVRILTGSNARLTATPTPPLT